MFQNTFLVLGGFFIFPHVHTPTSWISDFTQNKLLTLTSWKWNLKFEEMAMNTGKLTVSTSQTFGFQKLQFAKGSVYSSGSYFTGNWIVWLFHLRRPTICVHWLPLSLHPAIKNGLGSGHSDVRVAFGFSLICKQHDSQKPMWVTQESRQGSAKL